jgi:DNA-binding PadR family transcriptional regulator
MSPIGSLAPGDASFGEHRRRVLEIITELDGEPLTGPSILRRVRERSTADESLLYPALHSLEADWVIRAEWQTDADGVGHRTYRKRRLLPPMTRRARSS